VTDPVAPATPSTFSVWRRRLSPLVLVFAVFVLGRETCNKKQHAAISVVIRVGRFDTAATLLRGEITVDQSVIATFEQQPRDGRLSDITLPPIPGGDSRGTAHIVAIVENRVFEFNRDFEMPGGARVNIDLEAELTLRLAK
jgi:hypothetical protein